jgi:Ser/Thr protein kinase RdoA (MazF antagonist)
MVAHLADPRGGALVCHNDVCPENVVFRDDQAIAILDFDFAAPGRRVWDLTMAARTWIPLVPPLGNDGGGAAGRAHRVAQSSRAMDSARSSTRSSWARSSKASA